MVVATQRMEIAKRSPEITRAKDRREGLRDASDRIDAEWSLIAPMLPKMNRIGRPRETGLRAVVDAILYMAATGCQWRHSDASNNALRKAARR